MIPEGFLRLLKEKAHELDVSVAEVVRQALVKYFGES